MPGFWAGGKYQYLIAIQRRYAMRHRVLSRRLQRAESLDQRDEVLSRMEMLESEFKEQTRNTRYFLF
jgi:hypothetical protein